MFECTRFIDSAITSTFQTEVVKIKTRKKIDKCRAVKNAHSMLIPNGYMILESDEQNHKNKTEYIQLPLNCLF